ncbi:hypothetical protein FRC03_006416 [Tulasnella sp. 419]|nr:hypothetical protein FRC03_006416 [Tulasnella sp. 419]
MAAETLYDIPLELKPITPFLRRAQELKLKDPTMNYWCTYYAIVQGVHLKPRERDSRNYLIKLMQPLEAVREDRNSNVITENDAACAYIETFALHVFDNADHEDRRGTASRQTARKFLAAANFLELLRVFEEYDSSNSAYSRQQEKIRYAKGKAADIAKAFREGRKPLPGPPLESTSPPPDLTLHPTTSNDPTLESSHQMPPSPESTTHIQTTLVNDVPDSKASSPSPGSSRETPISPKNRNEKLPLSGSGSSFDHGRDALESEIDIDIRAPSSPPGSNVPSLPPDDSYPTGLAIQRGRETVIVKKGGETTHYQLENFLGSGQFGSVYRALDLDTKKVVVIKQIKLESLPQKQVNELIKEVELLRVLSHPKIVKYEAMFREEDTLNLVLE